MIILKARAVNKKPKSFPTCQITHRACLAPFYCLRLREQRRKIFMTKAGR